jgi:hypothetical protein
MQQAMIHNVMVHGLGLELCMPILFNTPNVNIFWGSKLEKKK